MPKTYTRSGDDGTTGLLGKGRVPKFDPRLETLGAIDEATAMLGIARAVCRAPETGGMLIRVQRDLYHVMAEVAATPENVSHFRVIGDAHIEWLEERIEALNRMVEIPDEFILPGDSYAGSILDLARTVVRRAERRVAELFQRGQIENGHLLGYLNRLSSLCFLLELRENQADGRAASTLAKPELGT